MDAPILKRQEIPFDSEESRFMFRPSPDKPLVATNAAIQHYRVQIQRCLLQLQKLADEHDGLDYLQVFDDPDKPEALWFIEDDAAITAMLPSDH